MTIQQFIDIRHKAGLTQVEFGKRIGLKPGSIGSIESNRNPVTEQTRMLVELIFPLESAQILNENKQNSEVLQKV